MVIGCVKGDTGGTCPGPDSGGLNNAVLAGFNLFWLGELRSHSKERARSGKYRVLRPVP